MSTTVIVSPLDETPSEVVVESPYVGATQVVVEPVGLQGLQGPTGPSVTVGGTDTQVLFNDGGTISGTSGLTWDKTTNTLTAPHVKFVSQATGGADIPWEFQHLNGNGFRIKLTASDRSVTFGTGMAANMLGVVGNFEVANDNAFMRWMNGNGTISYGVITSDGGAAHTLAMRNGVSGQTFRVYNSYTDNTNYERGTFSWSSNILTIGTEAAGTGVARELRIGTNGQADLTFIANGGAKWAIKGSGTVLGHLHATSDNAFDIGSSATGRPRHVFVGGTLNPAGQLILAQNAVLQGEAANVLALRNGVNAQAFKAYNTYTDAANYERATFGWQSSVLVIGHEFAGTGTDKFVKVKGQGITFAPTSAGDAWQFGNGGHLYAMTDNTFNIGLPSGSRPANVYVGSEVRAPVTGQIRLYNGTDNTGAVQLNSAGGTSGQVTVYDSVGNVGAGLRPSSLMLGNNLVNLVAEANGVAALRNGIANQQLYFYNTYTDGANYERGFLGWSGNELRLGIGVAGTGVASRALGLWVGNNGTFSIKSSSSGATYVSYDMAGGVWEQKNGATAQAMRLYNSYTDAANYERGFVRWGSNELQIGTEASGTGVARRLNLMSGSDLYFNVGGLVRWYINTTGHLLALADNTYDIGASGANRPRNVYVGGFIHAATHTRTSPVALASLPTAATAGMGARAFIIDADRTLATSIGTVAVGGSSNKVPVYSDGTNWLVG